MPSEKTMRNILGLKSGERAANEDLASHREYYQHSMVEMNHAEEWWKASTKLDRQKYTRVHPIDWEFLSALEHMLVTVYLLNRGQVAADLEYEAKLKI